MTGAIQMVEIWRGDFAESAHRGHAVICDAKGNIRAAWGNPEAVMLPRSSCKMLQALPLVESGAILTTEQLALSCASHQGAEIHVSRVSRWLAEMGMTDDDLRCGTQVPDDRPERARLRDIVQSPCQMHNNCSGKHAGFLMLNRHLGGEPEYVDPDHPVQKAVRQAFEEMTGADSPGYGIDGCSAPNFATTMHGLAWAMARMADPTGLGPTRESAARRLVAAMVEHPLLVAGEGRACSELMTAIGGAVAVKTGAEGVFTAIWPERGLGIALKIEDGGTRASECAITALLCRLGLIDPSNPAAARRLWPRITNRRGLVVGHIAPASAFWANGAAL